MKFDLIYEMATDKPDDRRAVQTVYRQALEQILLAEELDYSTVWEVEHHFLREFSHSPAPEVFLAAVAQATSKIRIGHGCVLLPHAFNHPIRVAERIATLDIISDGRVEFGTARSSEYELAGFEISLGETRAMWQEAISIIPKMWHDGDFSYEGRFLSIPPRQVTPKPIQDPHPPMWMACTSPESWRIAGLNGLGVLGFSYVASVDELKNNLNAYREALKTAEPAGDFINSKVAIATQVYCTDDNEQALEEAYDACAWTVLNNFKLLAPKTSEGGWQSLAPEVAQMMVAIEAGARDMYEMMNERNAIIVGSPEKCIEKVQMFADLGADHIICQTQMHGMAHERIMSSIDLFGRKVIPAFSDS